MTREDIITNINKLLVDEFEIDENSIVPSAGILEVLKIDSLDLVDLVVLIEKKFGFKVQGEDMAAIKTMEDFYEFIINRLAVQNK
jgi:acyl carrier protein